ncbi:MAG TPA: MFS transporter, partial [Vicinamibacteria bacterium]|nr:MFS transporter [Vicinamibacteria bacterium]
MTDRRLLYASAFLRALATGFVGVLLGVYLAQVGLDAGAIGVVVGAGLAGAATATLTVTVLGDRIGHRRALLATAVAAAVGGVALALSSHPAALGAAAFLGMVNGMGRDRGAALVVEQAVLPATVDDAGRTMVFARYNVVQDAGHAAGGLLGGLPALLQGAGVVSGDASFRLSVLVYCGLVLLPAVAYLGLSSAIERRSLERGVRVSPRSRAVLWRISSLFAIDAIGGGFLTTALLAYFFYERFGVGLETIGPLFFLARLANAASHIVAAWLAGKIGLVNTMVFTHVPSSLLLV